METRGVRNNNPGNIRKSSDPWQGLTATQSDPDFFTFQSPPWGIRTIARILISYQDVNKINTIAAAISRWAPSTENSTDDYINTVCRLSGFNRHEVLNFHEYFYLFPVVKAIIRVECGRNPYPDEVITKGLLLAGVEAEKKAVVVQPTVKAAGVAAGLTTLSAAADQVNQFQPTFTALSDLAQYAPKVIAIIAVCAVGFFIWSEIQKRKVGL